MFLESIKVIQDYFNFRFNSKPKGGHGIHSPFVYDLYTQTIDNDRKEPIFEDIERLRSELLKNETALAKSIYGAGSTGIINTSISEVAKKTSIPPYMGRLLYRLVKNQKPETILELGTSLGISTMYLATGNQGSKVYSIEGDATLSKIASNNINKRGVTNVSLITSDFDAEIPSLLNSIEKIDMVFIDGNHTEEATMRYFNLLVDKVNSESIIIIDDIRWSEGMRSAWQNICNNKNVSISIDLFRCGLVFFRKGIVKQHFNLRYGPF